MVTVVGFAGGEEGTLPCDIAACLGTVAVSAPSPELGGCCHGNRERRKERSCRCSGRQSFWLPLPSPEKSIGKGLKLVPLSVEFLETSLSLHMVQVIAAA
ncbi:uncharacterized protein DS421_16g547800 [Arachis hypogaea]|nr:uncharacterized protein DS421_16g547800 [Arachis hypogaea]